EVGVRWGVRCLFFFFQAEDGIRDWSVTGVQTCALPISPRQSRICGGAWRVGRKTKNSIRPCWKSRSSVNRSGRSPVCPRWQATRSEERRVGKECRCRWAAECSKKKERRRGARGESQSV